MSKVNSEFISGNPLHFELTKEMIAAFKENGYILVRKLFDELELKKIEKSVNAPSMKENCYGVSDGLGKLSRMALWNQPGIDFTGYLARCEKLASTMEGLLGGEVYHYHTKLMMKEAELGGSHLWHQDYGYWSYRFCISFILAAVEPLIPSEVSSLVDMFMYPFAKLKKGNLSPKWYNNGCLYPDMGTVFIAVDRCTKTNACLQILEGSHKVGRIEHKKVAGQTAADPERVNHLKAHMVHKYVEMEPGDALFFHSNLLHSSDQNLSLNRRYALLVAYNRASNDPIIEHHHPQYTKLIKVSNEEMRACEVYDKLDGKDFFQPFMDTSKGQVTAVKITDAEN